MNPSEILCDSATTISAYYVAPPLASVYLNGVKFLLKGESLIPPGGVYKYLDPDTGKKVQHPYFFRAKELARKHRLENGLPVPVDWDDKFIDIICGQQPEICTDTPTITEQASSLARSLVRWALSGFPVCTEEEVLQRLAICQGDGTNPACVHFRGYRENGHIRCGQCGCRLRKKAYLKTESCPIGKW